MPKTRPAYAPEFRRQMVDLVRAGRDPEDLAREFEPTSQSIRHWVMLADRQEGRREEKGDVLVAANGNIYYGLWYPIAVALLTVVVGFLFIKDRKDVDLHA